MECEEHSRPWLPEDEIINIKCKPQDRAVAGQNAINFQEAM